jgi:hypothetical protein
MTARKKKLSISSIGGSNKKDNMKGNGKSSGNGNGSSWSFGRWGSTKSASTSTNSSVSCSHFLSFLLFISAHS